MRIRTTGYVRKALIRLVTYPQLVRDRLNEQAKHSRCVAHNTVRLLPESSIVNVLAYKDKIQIGANTISRGECLVFNPVGSIKIGSFCYIGEHTRIWSGIGITIGNKVLISHSVNIHDIDSHSKSASRRHAQIASIFAGRGFDMTDVDMAQIVIQDDVWIGFNAAIMKGVTVGKGAIIGAATVITKDVPQYAIMVGNPARQIGTSSE